MRKSLEERFLSRIEYTEDCWIWTAGKNKKGYGQIKVSGKQEGAHRLSFTLYKGDPSGMIVCHSCDNPSCVNPQHLWLGTPKDNMQDKERKGRGHNSKKTHCPRGHLYNNENTYFVKGGGRNCRVCDREKRRT